MDLLAQALNQLAPKNVGIEEFSESSSYCNKPLFPAQAVLLKTIFLEELTGPEEDILSYWIAGGRNGTEITISPNVRERVEWLRGAGYPHFREIALVGGRRSSKGFMTGLAMASVMWSTLQLQDPGAHYGIDPEKEIYFSCIAGSQEQSQGRQYADFSSTVEMCKAFDPYLVKSLETEIRVATNVDLRRIAQEKGRGNRIQKDIARLRGNAMAANSGTIRGLAMMCYAIDEIAHMLPGESKSSPNKIYEAANPSLGQFGVDGLAFLNSSPYTKIGLFYEKYVEGLLSFDPTGTIDEPTPLLEDGIDLNRNGEPRLLVFQFPSWAMYEGYQKSKNRAKLKSALMGSPDWDLDEKDENGENAWTDKDIQLSRAARAEEQANPEGFKVEYRGKFAEVTDAYMEPHRIDEMFGGLPSEWVYDENSENPDVPRLQLQSLSTNTGKNATNMFRYKFHLDPSSTTAGFGFAIAHTEKIADWKGVEDDHVVFDLIKRWQPQKFPGCFDDQTEVFTEQGWMLFQDVDDSTKVATRTADGRLQFHLPTGRTKQFYDGDLYAYDSRNLSFRITPNHRLLSRTRKSKKDFDLEEIQKITVIDRQVPRTAVIDRPNNGHEKFQLQYIKSKYDPLPPCRLEDFAAFVGIWLAEGRKRFRGHQRNNTLRPSPGNGYASEISQRKLEGIAWIDDLFVKLGWPHERKINNKTGEITWNIKSCELREFLCSLVDSQGHEIHVPDEAFTSWGPDAIESFIDGLLMGDGSYSKQQDRRFRLNSTSLALSKEIQRLLSYVGRYGNITLGTPKGTVRRGYSSNYDVWHTHIEDHTPYSRCQIDKVTRIPYKGYVYCFSVPNETLLTRRNNTVFWSGNSVIRWPTILAEVMEYAEFFFPFEITMDQFQSIDPIQQLTEKLNERNISTQVRIVNATAELNWKRWEILKTSIYAKLVHAPNDTEDARWCAQELKFLQIQGGTSKYPRVDRQEIGPCQTKDEADCVAECVNALIGNQISNRTRERLSTSSIYGGAEGGYGIGFSGTGPKGGGGPEGISDYYSTKDRKAQQEYQSPTRGALGRGRGSRRGSNRARW